MIQAALLLLGCLSAVSAADIPITWVIPENQMPYPTQFVNVGDTVTFNWQGLHGVYLLENGPSVGCPAQFASEGPAVVAPAAAGGVYTFPAAEPGTYNLACQVGDHCTEGMIVSVVVGTGPALAPGAEAPSAPSQAPASAPESGGDDDGATGS